MAHLHYLLVDPACTICRAPKGGAAKLKAYVALAQRASAGEAHPATW